MSNFQPLKVVGRGSETQLQMGENLNKLKQLRGMISILIFSFVMKYFIPQIMILFFSEFLNDFFINISINPLKTQTDILYN